MSDQQGNEAPIPGVVSEVEAAQALPGALLAAQRQAKGWSVEHAASQLKFATRQVLALEADNYAALPGAVIVRGFVRAYAKLLGMDANALVAGLPEQGALPGERIVPQRTLSTPFSESPLPLGNRKGLSPAWVIGGVVLLVVVVAGVVLHQTDLLDRVPQLAWLKHGGKPGVTQEEQVAQAPAAEQADLPAEVQDGSDHGKQDKSDVAADTAAASASPATASVAEQAASSSVAPVAAPAPVTPALVAAAVAPVAAASPAAANAGAAAAPVTANLNISKSKDLLRLNFREDSWVEIRRGDNSTMISRLLKAGTTESFDITEPVTLVVGNVAGVDASLRGAKLDLLTGNNNNVARLSLK